MGAKDILAELAEIGVLGEAPSKAQPSDESTPGAFVDRSGRASAPEVTIDKDFIAPERQFTPANVRDLQMIDFCDRVVSVLQNNVQAQVELIELFSQMRDMWLEDADIYQEDEAESDESEDGPGDEDDESDEMDESDDDDGEDVDEEDEEGETEEPPPSAAKSTFESTGNAILDDMAAEGGDSFKISDPEANK